MKKLIVTFGQSHVHLVNGKIFDRDCVAVIHAPTIEKADALAFELFDGKFHQHVDFDKWDHSAMKYFPRGYIDIGNNDVLVSDTVNES